MTSLDQACRKVYSSNLSEEIIFIYWSGNRIQGFENLCWLMAIYEQDGHLQPHHFL